MSTSTRNFRIDNIKGILIFFVVFGHLVETHIAGAPVIRTLWIFIYAIHMPMFALVSGMFSRSSIDESKQSN